MKAFLFSTVLIIFISCSKKTVPTSERSSTKSTGATSTTEKNNSTTTTTTNNSNNTGSRTTTSSIGKPLIVVDGKGELIVSTETLLANGAKTGYSATNARAFTPEQRANLIARFKTVPPRVLYVPDRFSKKTAQGQYYVLKEKFWYWKKADGFYYLDENYYK